MIWDNIFHITEYLGIPRATYYQWRSRGYVPPSRHYEIVSAAVELGLDLTNRQLYTQYKQARSVSARG